MNFALKKHVATRFQKGLAFLEMMIVVAILGLLASVIVVAVMNLLDRAKVATTKKKMKRVKGGLFYCKEADGTYPISLAEIFGPPGATASPKDNDIFKDFWGNEFLYFMPSRSGKDGPYELFSKGPDGQQDTEDDIHIE